MIKLKEKTEQFKTNGKKGNKTMKKIIFTIVLATAAFFASSNAFARVVFQPLPELPDDSYVAFWKDGDLNQPLQPEMNYTLTDVIDENDKYVLSESVSVENVWSSFVFDKNTKKLTKLPDSFISKSFSGNTIISNGKDVFYLSDSAFLTKDKELNEG